MKTTGGRAQYSTRSLNRSKRGTGIPPPAHQFNRIALPALLKLGQHNSLLVLVFALAIRIADLAGFFAAEK